MATLRFTLEYDGTDFEGWQSQPEGHRTVQDTLETALRRVTGKSVRVVAAGRTDAGVHAEGQVASAEIETTMACPELQRALNTVLPRDLAVAGLEEQPDGFHAQHDARSKLYRYRIWNAPWPSPLRARRSHWLRAPLDVAAMAEVARHFEGRHDFASLQTSGSEVSDTVRTLYRVEVAGDPGGEIRVEVEGSGFLRHMVRSLVGILLEVGRRRLDPASVPSLLAARDRRAAPPTAPARGLTLVRVDYGFPQ
jgi:tRNA pseudouridine38-40 synthase